MEKPVEKSRQVASSGSLREAVSRARLEAAQGIDAMLDLRSSELARLEILKGLLEPVFDEIPPDDSRFELALVPSTPARLWIDMFTFVEMDGDCALYRLVRNARSGRRVLADSRDVGRIKEWVTGYIAAEIVARERQLAGLAEAPRAERRRRRLRVGLVVSAFVIGVLTGVAGLIAIGWVVTR